MPDAEKHKRFSFDCHESVYAVRFCSLEFCNGLLAIGTSDRVIVVNCEAKEERTGVSDIAFEQIAEYNHGARVTDISWSPQTDLLTIPRCLRLFTAGADKLVRCLTSDLKSNAEIINVGEHKGHVNAVASSPDNSDRVASVSDDLTCRVWMPSGNGQHLICFPLTSPGMAVCWHTRDVGKIMVAEKRGIIRFYSTVTQQAFMSLECGQAPLVTADWSPTNELRVVALAGTDWFIFDTSRSSHPLESKQAHFEGGHNVRWCSSHDYLMATVGRPGFQLKVFNIRTNQAILCRDLKITNGLCWHSRLPLIAVGGDQQVVLWVVDIV
jgi:nuclear pore complex protein Nup37